MWKREREREREREVPLIVDIKNKHVVVIKNFPSQILNLLVLSDKKRTYINMKNM